MSAVNANFTDGAFTLTDDAGHSATLGLSEGNLSLGPIAQDGHEITVSETRGHVSGVRKAARKRPTLSVTGKLSTPRAAFDLLAQGLTTGFVSVVADLGDAAGCDWDFSFDRGAEARDYHGDDAVLTEMSVSEADPSTVSFSFDLLGPVYTTDSGGTTTLISAR